MRFSESPLAGAFLVDLNRNSDERGSFARAFCAQEFAEHGLPARFPQANISTSAAARTLRGLHFNRAPFGEAKLVRCTRGAMFNVIVDLRPGSATRWQWFGATLTPDTGTALFVPADFAHGFVTLEPDTDAFYLMDSFYRPDAACGVRWDDPALGIEWPCRPAVISDRDASYPDIDPDRFDLAGTP